MEENELSPVPPPIVISDESSDSIQFRPIQINYGGLAVVNESSEDSIAEPNEPIDVDDYTDYTPVHSPSGTSTTLSESHYDSNSDSDIEIVDPNTDVRLVQTSHVNFVHEERPPNPIPPIDQDFPNERQQNALPEASCSTVKPASSSPPANTHASTSSNEDSESECCPICFEGWTNSGVHRLCSLKCGHLFGQSCIERWLKGQQKHCPQCNTKASKKDIRVLYAKALKVLDTTEKEQALKQLEAERKERKKMELEAAGIKLRYQLALDECKRLQSELENTKNSSGLLSKCSDKKVSVPNTNEKYALIKSIKVSEMGGCRVLAHSSSQACLAISQPSSNHLFGGFGVKKLDTLDLKNSQFLPLHDKVIRDVCFGWQLTNSNILLTASMDNRVKLTNISNNNCVQTYNMPAPVWSCCYNKDNANYVYTGLQNGSVCVLDLRNTAEILDTISAEGNRSPIVSLQFVPKADSSDFSLTGLLVGQLSQMVFHEILPDQMFRLNILPCNGNLTSLSFEDSSRHLLSTYRPSPRYPHIRNQLCRLTQTRFDEAISNETNLTCSYRVVQSFNGGSTHKLLSRNKLLQHPTDNEKLLICAGDEASQSMMVHDVSTGSMLQRISAPSPVLDICSIESQQNNLIALLTDKNVIINKWTQIGVKDNITL